MPMHQAEVMWLCFRSSRGYPFAVKVAAGKVNAVSAQSWSEVLNRWPQDYVVSPGLPWFDYYDKELETLEGASVLAGLDSVAAKGIKKGAVSLPKNDPVSPGNVKVLTRNPTRVKEGEF